jgi:hypothetical protein
VDSLCVCERVVFHISTLYYSFQIAPVKSALVALLPVKSTLQHVFIPATTKSVHCWNVAFDAGMIARNQNNVVMVLHISTL